MTVKDINNRIHDLEASVELLKAIRQEFIDDNRDKMFIEALDDGINYTSRRLEKYKTTHWIMEFE